MSRSRASASPWLQASSKRVMSPTAGGGGSLDCPATSEGGRVAGRSVRPFAAPHVSLRRLQVVVLRELVLLLEDELLAVVPRAEASGPGGGDQVRLEPVRVRDPV